MDQCVHHPLEIAYWIAQIFVLLVAIYAALSARRQLRFSTFFELTRYLQESKRREFRERAYSLMKTPLDQWNQQDHEAVSDVFSSFDVVGMMADQSLASKEFFAEYYQDVIVDMRRGHGEYLKFRRAGKTPRYWGYMEKLYKEAVLFKDEIKPSRMYHDHWWHRFRFW